ncbi:MAG: SpoIIE family protein phosphatase [Acidobacteriota bacterium]|nr:SpoIIE family protein phosphatase [Acidobacteriota bacterium]
MAHRKAIRWLLAAFCLLAVVSSPAGISAQDRSPHASLSHGGNMPQIVSLGTSAIELNWPWRFHTGDDPDWATTNFDDSSWDTLDLSPRDGYHDPFLGTSGYVPGWTARGYANYTGFAWYRLHLELQSDFSQANSSQLQIKMPTNVDDAYQVFVNGQLIGEFGKFTQSGVVTYATLPRAFALPPDIHDGPITVAIRVYMGPATPLFSPDSGGMHGPPLIGLSSSIQALLSLDWSSVDRSQYSGLLTAAIVLLALVVVTVLFRLEPTEKSYLWLILTLTVVLLQSVLSLVMNYSTLLTGDVGFLLSDAIFPPLAIGLWVLFWAHWFRMKEMKKLYWMVGVLVVLSIAVVAMQRAPLYGWVIPVQASVILSPLSMLVKLLLGSLLLWITWESMRHDSTGGWLALPAVALIGLTLYQNNLFLLKIPVNFFFHGYGVKIGQIAVVLSLNIITILLMRRFLQLQRRREQMRLEVQQAQQVQHVLIPEAIPTIPGFAIESAYYPAQEVGGDFFQILPDRAGGVLIVLGDVAGKGLQAGMLVALIVGALHTIVETSIEPAYVLDSLNRRLCARGRACATCIAIHIDANGETAIANAGHLPPYLSKKEVAIEGNLPLGMVPNIRFEETYLVLKPGERMTLMTDGVVEARDGKGELFGFSQTRSISHLPASFIAKAAQIFGQDDDITVVSVSLLAPENKANSGSFQVSAGLSGS